MPFADAFPLKVYHAFLNSFFRAKPKPVRAEPRRSKVEGSGITETSAKNSPLLNLDIAWYPPVLETSTSKNMEKGVLIPDC